jgi:SH3-like domain-containing protein
MNGPDEQSRPKMIHRAPAGCFRVLCLVLGLSLGALPVSAQTAEPPLEAPLEAGTAPGTDIASTPRTGPVTNLPLPRFVSMKAAEGNVRRGPSLTHRIDWVFKHRNMPLEITGEYGHWRRVRDRDGAGGWMHYSLLSGARTVIVEQDLAPVLSQPNPDAPVRAHAELGVIARLEGCENDWCRIRAGRTRGWIEQAQLWGVTHTPPPSALPEGEQEAEAYSGLAITR